MNKEARQAFLQFAESPDTPWRGNFRGLNAAVTRMATLAPRSRIRVEEVTEEIARLRESWQRPGTAAPEEAVDLATVLDEAALAELDPFVARTAAESGPCLGAANRFGGKPASILAQFYLENLQLKSGFSRMSAVICSDSRMARAGTELSKRSSEAKPRSAVLSPPIGRRARRPPPLTRRLKPALQHASCAFHFRSSRFPWRRR